MQLSIRNAMNWTVQVVSEMRHMPKSVLAFVLGAPVAIRVYADIVSIAFGSGPVIRILPVPLDMMQPLTWGMLYGLIGVVVLSVPASAEWRRRSASRPVESVEMVRDGGALMR